jgi:hypothetical protein
MRSVTMWAAAVGLALAVSASAGVASPAGIEGTGHASAASPAGIQGSGHAGSASPAGIQGTGHASSVRGLA